MRVLFDDGKAVIDMTQAGVGHLVGPLVVRLDIVEALLEIRLNRLADPLVSTVGDLERLLADGMLLEGLDAVVDHGIAGDVGEELA